MNSCRRFAFVALCLLGASIAEAGCPFAHTFGSGLAQGFHRKLRQVALAPPSDESAIQMSAFQPVDSSAIVETEELATEDQSASVTSSSAEPADEVVATEAVAAATPTIRYSAQSTCTTAQFNAIAALVSTAAASAPRVGAPILAPNMVRLTFHACGTYDTVSKTGGCEGAWMRFTTDNPNNFSGNDGLQPSLGALNDIRRGNTCITFADLWTLAGAVALKVMGGPKITWRPGRRDAQDPDPFVPVLSARLPAATFNASQLSTLASTLGLTAKELTALIGGGHTIGHAFQTHAPGFNGAWTRNPVVFNGNEFFTGLYNEQWVQSTVVATGKVQFVAAAPAGSQPPFKRANDNFPLFRLPSDMALKQAPFGTFATAYKNSQASFLTDFAAVMEKVSNLGVASLITNGYAW